MRKKGMKNVVIICSIATMLGCLLTACGNKEQIAYTTENADITVEADVEAEIPEHVTYEIEGEGGTVIVDADVLLPENHDKCAVVEYSVIRFTDEDVKRVVSEIFDDDSYFLYMPYSQAEIEYAKDKLTSIRDASADERERYTLQNELINLDNRLDNLSPVYSDMEEIKELKLYSVPAEDEWHPEMEKCCIIGTIEGQYYYLLIAQGADKGNVVFRLQRLRDMNIFDTNENLSPDGLEVQAYENACVYSKEEAGKLAAEYIQALGYTDYEEVEIFDCKENSYGPSQEIREMNSYNIYFARKVDGYAPAFTESNFSKFHIDTLNSELAIAENTPAEYIRVTIDSDGIGEVFVFNPMKEEQILESHAKLIEFDAIDSRAREDLQGIVDRSYDGMQMETINIKEIELGYGYTYDMETDRYALIPVWFYIKDDSSNNSYYRRTDFYSYNALDGSYKDSWGVTVISY